MSKLNNISINITLQTAPTKQAGFGLALVLGSGASEKAYAEVGELSEMTAAGYTSSDAEYKIVQAILAQSPRVEKVAVYRKLDATEYADALDALVTANKGGWYCVVPTSTTPADLADIADWVEASDRIMLGLGDDIADVSTRTGNRESYWFHSDLTSLIHARLAGVCLPYDPGEVTWAHKRASGATDSGFDQTVTDAIIAANGNVFAENASGFIVSYPGKMMSGEFIDVITSRDYVKARLTEALSRLLTVNGKVGYTIREFERVEAEMRSVFNDCGRRKIIATVDNEDDLARSDEGRYQYKITLPTSLDDIPTADRSNRILPISFSFRIAGAVHDLDIDGTITV